MKNVKVFQSGLLKTILKRPLTSLDFEFSKINEKKWITGRASFQAGMTIAGSP
jgi:hypothetical protein